MLYMAKKHFPEEAHLNRWAKRRLIIKKSPEDLIYLLNLKPGGKLYEITT